MQNISQIERLVKKGAGIIVKLYEQKRDKDLEEDDDEEEVEDEDDAAFSAVFDNTIHNKWALDFMSVQEEHSRSISDILAVQQGPRKALLKSQAIAIEESAQKRASADKEEIDAARNLEEAIKRNDLARANSKKLREAESFSTASHASQSHLQYGFNLLERVVSSRRRNPLHKYSLPKIRRVIGIEREEDVYQRGMDIDLCLKLSRVLKNYNIEQHPDLLLVWRQRRRENASFSMNFPETPHLLIPNRSQVSSGVQQRFFYRIFVANLGLDPYKIREVPAESVSTTQALTVIAEDTVASTRKRSRLADIPEEDLEAELEHRKKRKTGEP